MKNKRDFYGIDTGGAMEVWGYHIASNLVFYVLSTRLCHGEIKKNRHGPCPQEAYSLLGGPNNERISTYVEFCKGGCVNMLGWHRGYRVLGMLLGWHLLAGISGDRLHLKYPRQVWGWF